MISFLRGTLVVALPTRIVVDVHGVGYRVDIPLSSFDRLPEPGTEIKILTHLAVREDSHQLYGFMSESERDLFELLVAHVTGIGPKAALSILSGMPVAQFKSAVVAGDIAMLARIKGLGRKTAERIVVELKDRVGVTAAWEAASADHAPSPAEQSVNDAVLALISLGYRQVDAHKAVRSISTAGVETMPTEDLIRRALRVLAS
jgi:Holliday junction DNA helicase RuvA